MSGRLHCTREEQLQREAQRASKRAERAQRRMEAAMNCSVHSEDSNNLVRHELSIARQRAEYERDRAQRLVESEERLLVDKADRRDRLQDTEERRKRTLKDRSVGRQRAGVFDVQSALDAERDRELTKEQLDSIEFSKVTVRREIDDRQSHIAALRRSYREQQLKAIQDESDFTETCDRERMLSVAKAEESARSSARGLQSRIERFRAISERFDSTVAAAGRRRDAERREQLTGCVSDEEWERRRTEDVIRQVRLNEASRAALLRARRRQRRDRQQHLHGIDSEWQQEREIIRCEQAANRDRLDGVLAAEAACRRKRVADRNRARRRRREQIGRRFRETADWSAERANDVRRQQIEASAAKATEELKLQTRVQKAAQAKEQSVNAWMREQEASGSERAEMFANAKAERDRRLAEEERERQRQVRQAVSDMSRNAATQRQRQRVDEHLSFRAQCDEARAAAAREDEERRLVTLARRQETAERRSALKKQREKELVSAQQSHAKEGEDEEKERGRLKEEELLQKRERAAAQKRSLGKVRLKVAEHERERVSCAKEDKLALEQDIVEARKAQADEVRADQLRAGAARLKEIEALQRAASRRRRRVPARIEASEVAALGRMMAEQDAAATLEARERKLVEAQTLFSALVKNRKRFIASNKRSARMRTLEAVKFAEMRAVEQQHQPRRPQSLSSTVHAWWDTPTLKASPFLIRSTSCPPDLSGNDADQPLSTLSCAPQSMLTSRSSLGDLSPEKPKVSISDEREAGAVFLKGIDEELRSLDTRLTRLHKAEPLVGLPSGARVVRVRAGESPPRSQLMKKSAAVKPLDRQADRIPDSIPIPSWAA